MNTETGEIKTFEEVKRLPQKDRKKYIPFRIPPTVKQLKRKRVLLSEKCACGSGKAFAKCCKSYGIQDATNGK